MARLSNEFPPYSTVQRYFYDGRASGLPQTIRFALAVDWEKSVAAAEPSINVSQIRLTTRHLASDRNARPTSEAGT